MTKLNSRDWLIYRIIRKHTSEDPKGYATQKEIFDEVNGEMPGSLRWVSNKGTHDPCFPIWSTVSKLNQSPEIEKIIVIDDFKYYLATKEEAERYIENLKDQAMRKLKRASSIMRKYGMDGQGKLLSCQGNEIGEGSKAREFTEAFL